MIVRPVSPRVATARNLELPTTGHRIDNTARLMGHPLMPHQRLVVDLAGETRPDGRPRFHTVIVTVQRQAGKTTMLQALMAGRALSERDYRAWYTAQTGIAARRKYRDLVGMLQASPLGSVPGLLEVRRSSGDEVLRVGDSTVSIFAPRPDALHGESLDLLLADEAWARTMEEGNALLQAARPAGAARPRVQYWIVSTAGDGGSEWFRGMVERARADTLAGVENGVCFVEYGCGPEVAELDGEPLLDAVIAAHPAVGRTIPAEFLRAELSVLPRDEFLRAYANVWVGSSESVFPLALWAAVQDEATAVGRPRPGAEGVALAVDVGFDRSSGVIASAWRDSDGLVRAAVVASGDGTDWIGSEAARLSQWLGAPVLFDAAGPAAAVLAGMPAARALPSRDVSQGCARLYDAVVSGRVLVARDPLLSRAVESAAKSARGDTFVWTRRKSVGDISALYAVTLASGELLAGRPDPVMV